MMLISNTILNAEKYVAVLQTHLAPLVQLVARGYIAKIFFLSGLSKWRDWTSTLSLFEEEYHVPLLAPDVAAYLSTGGELLLPILLALGLMSRLSAAGLFLLNIVAVLAYYHVLGDMPVALQDHLEWGIIMALLMIAKPGLLSLDYWLNAAARRTSG
jgi:putative oxidoreductase